MANPKPNIIVNTIWSSFQRFGGMAISFIANIVLARLLCPEDFGTVAMIYVFVGIANVLVEGGFGSSLIQKKDLTQKDISTVFSTNFVISIALFLLLLVFASFIESFTVAGIRLFIQVEALQILIRAFYIVPHSMLTKALEFKRIAIYNIVASCVSLMGAILFALAGMGIWSLIIKNLLLDSVLLLMYLSRGSKYLHFGFDKNSFKELFGFGAFITLYNLLETLYTNTIAFLIGKKYSVKELGYYNQAYSLQQIPVYSVSDVLNNILFPYFSALQNESGQVRRLMKASIEATVFFVFPTLAFFIAFSDQIIVLLYSEKWLPCVPYFRVFCIMGLFTTLININRSALKSSGKSLHIFLIQLIAVIIGIVLLVIGIHFSLMMAVISLVISSTILYVIVGIVAGNIVGYSLINQICDCIFTAIISFMSAVIVYLAFHLFKLPIAISLFLELLSYSGVYLLIHMLFHTSAFSTVKIAIISVRDKARL